MPEGRSYGFISENGAGKTTTMKIILGLLAADGGEIRICGEKVGYGQTRTNRFIGYRMCRNFTAISPRRNILALIPWRLAAGVPSGALRKRADDYWSSWRFHHLHSRRISGFRAA
ncbi:MAG: ATP-binding cassette domain-containing protein [Eubacteriales bacterium]